MVEVFVRLCTDKPEDKKKLLELIDENCKTVELGQQSIVDEDNVDPATDKQRALMKKLHIVFDDDISKSDASSLISKKMEDK